MLNLAEHVNKRFRKGSFSAEDDGIADNFLRIKLAVPQSICAPQSKRPPSSPLSIADEVNKNLSFSQHKVAKQPPIKLEVDDLEQRQDWLVFGDAHQSLDGRSWDEISRAASATPVAPRTLDYDAESKSRILFAAANAAMGFTSDLVDWNASEFRLELNPALIETSFAHYLTQFAHTGSLVRRLLLATVDLREWVSHAGNLEEGCTVLALTASIEKEIKRIQAQGRHFHRFKTLLQLASECEPHKMAVKTLAELVGCHGKHGRLARVPSSTELLERAFRRACTLDSRVLWRVVGDCLKPMLMQLNFVIGLSDPLAVREPKMQLKHVYFPELFVTISESPPSVGLDDEEVPQFFAPRVALTVVECYTLLCCLGLKGPDSAKRASESEVNMLSLGNCDQERQKILAPSEGNLADGLAFMDTQMQAGVITTTSEVEEPRSIRTQLRHITNKIFLRAIELNQLVKREFMLELQQFSEVVCNVYLLQDGVLYSLLTNMADAFTSQNTAAHLDELTGVNDFVQSRYKGVEINVDLRGSCAARVCYEPLYMNDIFGTDVILACDSVFAKLIELHATNQIRELALYCSTVTSVAARIQNTLITPSTGMHDIKLAFDSIATELTA